MKRYVDYEHKVGSLGRVVGTMDVAGCVNLGGIRGRGRGRGRYVNRSCGKHDIDIGRQAGRQGT